MRDLRLEVRVPDIEGRDCGHPIEGGHRLPGPCGIELTRLLASGPVCRPEAERSEVLRPEGVVGEVPGDIGLRVACPARIGTEGAMSIHPGPDGHEDQVIEPELLLTEDTRLLLPAPRLSRASVHRSVDDPDIWPIEAPAARVVRAPCPVIALEPE